MMEQKFDTRNKFLNIPGSDVRRDVKGGIVTACVIGLLSLGVTGCYEGTTDPAPRGLFEAAITGHVVTDYQGSGDFSMGHGPSFTVYHLRSEGEGASANQWFKIYHRTDPGDDYFDGLIAEGTHPITLLDRRDRDARGTSVIFDRTEDGKVYRYIASDGSLRITESTTDRAAGTFTLTAFRYCEISKKRQSCPFPSSTPADAPTIDVSGSFTAVPAEKEVQAL